MTTFTGEFLDLPGEIVFGHAPGKTESGNRKQNRIETANQGHRATLALIPIFLRDQPRLFSRRHVKRDALLVEYLHPRRAQVDPTRFGIRRDHRVGGAKVSAAVFTVQFWRREPRDIGIFADEKIFLDRALIFEHRRQRRAVAQNIFHRAHQLDALEIGGKPQSQGGPRLGLIHVGDQAVTARIALDIVKEQRRGIGLRGGDLGDRADFQIPIRALDDFKLAELLGAAQKLSQFSHFYHPDGSLKHIL